MEHVSPRVNAARLPKYVGQTVRVIAKVVKFSGQRAILELPDGGTVDVIVSNNSNMSDVYVEILARVEDAQTIKMLAVMNLGDKLDMAAINHTIELMHSQTMAAIWATKP